MEGIIKQVLREFGFKCHSVEKERAFFVCRTDKGIKSIKKVNLNITDILFQHHVKEVLYLNGFVNTDRFCTTAAGLPYYAVNGETYVAYDYIRFKETNFAEPRQFREIIRKVAEMHFICKDIEYDISADKGFAAKEIFDRNISDLQRYRRVINKQGQFSDFDITLLKHYDFYVDRLNDWYVMTVSDNCVSLSEEARRRKFVSHNLLKEETVLLSDGIVYITDFSGISINHHMHDLSDIIKRYIKCEPANTIPLEEVICIYDSYNPIGKDELDLLHTLLIYPDKFLKICEKYYSKKRTWTPSTFVSRMDSIISNCDFHNKYISDFF